MSERIYMLIVLILLISLFPIASNAQDNQKLAQTGFQYLSVPTSARASSIGEATTTVPMGSVSLFFNPAGMAHVNNFIDVSFGQTDWIADISYNSFSISVAPSKSKYGVFGFSLVSVDYGGLEGTMVWANTQGYIETGEFSPSAQAFGVGYAITLTDKFSVGGQAKLAYQSLGKNVIPATDSTNIVIKNRANATAYDFGTIYNTGFKSLAFGMSIRNFSDEIKFESEGFQLPLTFRMGISMNVLDFSSREDNSHSLMVSFDAVHPRSYPEYVNLGFEYSLLNLVSLRSGYIFNRDEQGLTIGGGIQKDLGGSFIAVDYSSVPFGLLGNVQIISFQFSI